MTRKLSPQQAGSLGEMMALAKLTCLGFDAYVSPEGAPGHDIMIIAGNSTYSVEVKTRQFIERPTEISRWPVDMKTKGDADFFLFVEVNMQSLTPTFYLLTNAQAKRIYKPYSGSPNCPPTAVRAMISPNDFSAI